MFTIRKQAKPDRNDEGESGIRKSSSGSVDRIRGSSGPQNQ